MPKFILSVSPNLHFYRLLLLKVQKLSAKKSTEELCLILYWKERNVVSIVTKSGGR